MPRGYPCPPDKPFSRAEWREKNRERIRAYFKKYRETYDRHEKEYKVGAVRNMLHNARRRAQLAGVPFNITTGDIVVPELCPILGIPLRHSRKKVSDNSPSLDRIKPELGYVKGNVHVISFRANTIKSNATLAEIEKVAEFMRGHC